MPEKILVTGAAGFIGMNLCKRLLQEDKIVLGIDNMNDYYDVALKKARIENLLKFKNFTYKKCNIINYKELDNIVRVFCPKKVVNLAAQAGVRYSIENPGSYIQSNVVGFMNILESCRWNNIEGLIYASSSSVYGGNNKLPFSESDIAKMPLSIYAASKRANELMAYSYHSLYGLNTTGLRFFTVYGPWGRPDMAMYIFTEKILNNQPISVFNKGVMQRDFTYIDDIISGVKSSIDKNFKNEIFNLGNDKSEDLMEMISIIERKTGKKAIVKFEDMQLGDVKKTHADISRSKQLLSYNPKVSIEKGIPSFIDWYNSFHDIRV